MGPQKDVEMSPSEIQKEVYLSRLSPQDRANLKNVGLLFNEIMQEEARKGSLVIVGGTLDKPLPRKDVDVLMVLQPHPTDVQKDGSTELDWALKDFQTFQHLIEKILDKNPSLQIKEIFEPAIDEEFDSPHILKTDGSMVVESKEEGIMPVEFIRMRKRGDPQQVAIQDNRPFVILEHT